MKKKVPRSPGGPRSHPTGFSPCPVPGVPLGSARARRSPRRSGVAGESGMVL